MKTMWPNICRCAAVLLAVAAAMPAPGASKDKLKGVGSLDYDECEKVGKYTWVLSPSDGYVGYGVRISDAAYVRGVSPAPSGAIAIPAKLGGAAVRGIGHAAFAGSTQLTRVTIPDGVTNIGEEAFRDCKELISVTIPNSVTNIGRVAFSDCRSLKSVTIPKSVTNIGDAAFSDCRSLKSVTIPNSVTNIGAGTFFGCRSLKSVMIPDSVKRIEHGAFRGCKALKSIHIPHSVESIDSGAFLDCDSLTAITVDADNPNYSSKNGLLLTKDGSQLLRGVGGDVVVPDGTSSIRAQAFANCTTLLSVTIPADASLIEPSSFANCMNLKCIVFAAGEESEDGEEPEHTIVMFKEVLMGIPPDQCVIYIPKYVDHILSKPVPGVWEGFTVEYIPDDTQGKAPSQWVSASKKPGAKQSDKAKAPAASAVKQENYVPGGKLTRREFVEKTFGVKFGEKNYEFSGGEFTVDRQLSPPILGFDKASFHCPQGGKLESIKLVRQLERVKREANLKAAKSRLDKFCKDVGKWLGVKSFKPQERISGYRDEGSTWHLSRIVEEDGLKIAVEVECYEYAKKAELLCWALTISVEIPEAEGTSD